MYIINNNKIGLCENCNITMKENHYNLCPICRGPIHTTTKVYEV